MVLYPPEQRTYSKRRIVRGVVRTYEVERDEKPKRSHTQQREHVYYEAYEDRGPKSRYEDPAIVRETIRLSSKLEKEEGLRSRTTSKETTYRKTKETTIKETTYVNPRVTSGGASERPKDLKISKLLASGSGLSVTKDVHGQLWVSRKKRPMGAKVIEVIEVSSSSSEG